MPNQANTAYFFYLLIAKHRGSPQVLPQRILLLLANGLLGNLVLIIEHFINIIARFKFYYSYLQYLPSIYLKMIHFHSSKIIKGS
jgi:hypothetical protein